MDNKKSPSIKIYSKQYYDRVLEEIKALDTSKMSPEKIYRIVLKKFGGIQITVKMVLAHTKITVYRITTYEPKEDEKQNPSSFSYNPNPTEIGRANLPGEHVFYGALHPFTCLKEMKDELSSVYYLSEWEYTAQKQLNIALLNANVDMSEETIASLITKGYESAVKSMFDKSLNQQAKNAYWYAIQSFSKLFNEADNKYYPITAAISSNWLYKLKKEQGGDIGMLMYPSVTSQNKEINLAIRKDIADSEDFRLKSVTKFHVSDQNFLGDYTVILERGFNNRLDKISWKKPKFSVDKVDLDNYEIHTQCGCKITQEEKDNALFNLGSKKYRLLKDSSKFIQNEIEKILKNRFRVGIKDLNFIHRSDNLIEFKLFLKLPNTWVKIKDDKHVVKYLGFITSVKVD